MKKQIFNVTENFVSKFLQIMIFVPYNYLDYFQNNGSHIQLFSFYYRLDVKSIASKLLIELLSKMVYPKKVSYRWNGKLQFS